jgi:uncharacterized Zn-binding protein involved in type VI secretion
MSKAAVRNGDPTTTRGFVVAYSSTLFDDGKHVALSGDEATCGNCKGAWKIHGTGRGMSENGRNVVVNGDLVLCPCKKNRVIVGSNPGIFLECDDDFGPATRTGVAPNSNGAANDNAAFDRHFQFVDETGDPVDGILVHLIDVNGRARVVATDGSGRTPILSGSDGQRIGVCVTGGRRQ